MYRNLNIDELAVGQEVGVGGGYGHAVPFVGRVTKIDKIKVVVHCRNVEYKFARRSGCELGTANSRFGHYLMPAEDARDGMRRDNEQRVKNGLVRDVQSTRFDQLSVSQLTQVVALLNSFKGPSPADRGAAAAALE